MNYIVIIISFLRIGITDILYSPWPAIIFRFVPTSSSPNNILYSILIDDPDKEYTSTELPTVFFIPMVY